MAEDRASGNDLALLFFTCRLSHIVPNLSGCGDGSMRVRLVIGIHDRTDE